MAIDEIIEPVTQAGGWFSFRFDNPSSPLNAI